MDIGQHSDKNRPSLLFFAALFSVILSVALFGTPVNAIDIGGCVLNVTNVTGSYTMNNITAYWGQSIVIGINVTSAPNGLNGAGAMGANGTVIRLNLTCANSTLCDAETPMGAALTATTDNSSGSGGVASITIPASYNPRYAGGPGVGALGGPMSPGHYETNFTIAGGTACASFTGTLSNMTKGVDIKGYYPFFTVSNIINATIPLEAAPYWSNIFNVTVNYSALPNPNLLNTSRHSNVLRMFNFTLSNTAGGAIQQVDSSAPRNFFATTGPQLWNAQNFNIPVGAVSTITVNVSAWSRDRMYVNISAATQDGWYVAYANTTVNYINIQVQNSDGSPFTSGIFMWKMNGATKTPMIPAGWGLNDAQAPPFLPLTAGAFTINCYDPDSKCFTATQTGMYSTSGSILGPGQTTGTMASELENAQIQVVAYDMASSNVTDIFPITPYANVNAINLTLNNSGAMSQFSVKTLSMTQGDAALTSMKVYDGAGVLRYVINSSLPDEFERSVPLRLGMNYSVEIAGTEESGQPFTTHNVTYMPVSKGFGGALMMVWNSTLSGYITAKGQVLSQFAEARNMTVYAEPRECHGGGPFVSVCIVNSTLTDANGIFQMRLPIIPGFNEYKFTAVDARRMGDGLPYSGALIHYPTKDNNNGRYYRAEGNQMIVPPINMTYAGTMSLNVGISSSTFGVMTELSRLRQLATGWVRDNFANRMVMANVFGDFMKNAAPITTLTFPMDSPTSGSYPNVLFFWGMGMTGQPGLNNPPSLLSGARNTATVSWRQFTGVASNTAQQGNLVLYVSMCSGKSVFSQAPCDTPAALDPMAQGGDNNYWRFWWNSKAVIYNASNFSQPYQYLEGDEDSLFLSRGKIPLMPGRYIIEITSKYDWEKPLSQNITVPFTINAGTDTNMTTYVFSPGWEIKSWIFPYTMRRTQGNEIHAGVFDFARMGGNPMLGPSSKVNLTFQAVNLNGTAAMQPINVSFLNVTYPDGKVAEVFRLLFTPSQYGLPAGKYIGLFRANLTNYTINPFNSANMAGTCASSAFCQAGIGGPKSPGYYADLYTTNKPWEYQFVISDFDIGAEPYKRSFVPGETIKATLYGFNQTSSVGLNGTVATYIYSDAGKLVGSTPTAWSLANMARYNMTYGIANLSIQAPLAVGWYEILSVVNVTTRNSTFPTDSINGSTERGWALSDMWVKVSNFGFGDKYDKKSYGVNDVAKLGITLTNGTTGTAIPNAAITAFVDQDQTPVFAITDQKGRAAVTLSKSGGWSYGGHNVRLGINSFNASGNNDVIKEEFFSWFNVGGIDVDFRTEKSKYSITDTVSVNVYASTGVSDSSAFTLYVDGNQTQATWTNRSGTVWWTANIAPQGQWTPGRHFMSLQVGAGGKGTAAFYSGFETAAVNMFVVPNQTDYVVGAMANFTVKIVNATSMQPVADDGAVSANIYKLSAGSKKVTNQLSGFISGGKGIASLNAPMTESGSYVIEAFYMGQTEYATFRVSGTAVTLSGASAAWSAGSALQFTINAAAQSTVEPTLWAYGKKLTVPSGTTDVSGVYLLNYSLSSDAPSGMYTLDVKVTTNTSVVGFNTTAFTISSAYRMDLSAGKSSFVEPFRQGDTATLTVSLRNGTLPAPGVNVTFVLGGQTITESEKGTAITDSSGKASVSAVTVPGSDGIYYAKAYVTDSPEVTAYTRLMVASLNVTLAVANSSTGSGTDTMGYGSGLSVPVTYNVTARNFDATGSIVNFSNTDTTGSISIMLFNENGGEISQSFNTSGGPTAAGMYSLNTTLPNSTSGLGSYTMVAVVKANNSIGIVTKTINLNTADLMMNVTTNPAAASIVANQTSFNVTVNVFNRAGTGQTGNAAVTIFSPTASGTPLYYAASYPVSSGVAIINVSATNLTAPGVYVIKAEFTGAGGSAMNSTIIRVRSAATPQSLGVVSVSSTSVNITSNVPNATAYVMTESGGRTTTMALTLVPNATGANYYTTVTALNSSATYFVRLDTVNSTGVNTTMFKTS